MKRLGSVLWTVLAFACAAVFLAIGVHADTVATMTADPAAAPTVTETVVNIPWGNIFNNSADFLITLCGVLIAWGLRLLPVQVSTMIKTSMLDQLLLKAIAYGINTTAGAEKDKALSLNVGNVVVAQALQYALDHAPEWAITYAGGAAMIEQKIIARLNVAADAAIAPSQ